MAQPVNLMRWREARRKRCLYFWGVMFSTTLFISLALVIAGKLFGAQTLARNAVYNRYESLLSQQLSQKEQQLITRQAQQKSQLQRIQRQQQTLSWQPRLLELAKQLPAQAWLTTLAWQQGQLVLDGLTSKFSELAVLDTALKITPGVHSVTAGAIHRDDSGRWQFSYQLNYQFSEERTSAEVP